LPIKTKQMGKDTQVNDIARFQNDHSTSKSEQMPVSEPIAKPGQTMRHAVCNELFGAMEFETQCAIAAEHGMQGLEIAPYTIADDRFLFLPSHVARFRTALERQGLSFAGFHWLLTKPEGMRLTSADAEEREKAVRFLLRLVDAAAELGGGDLVLGGPKQRNAISPVTTSKAIGYLIDAMRKVGIHAKANKCRFCVEALPKNQSNIINTLAESRMVIEACDDQGVTGMFDFHNTLDEIESWQTLIADNRDIISHVHVNTMAGGVPTAADADRYRPAFGQLVENDYTGWVSLEIFTSPHDPESIVRTYRAFLDSVWNNR
jgi:D-psicose/D-tagatose/L-ribulose 3-epimerase